MLRREEARRIYGLPLSTGAVFGPWLLARQPGGALYGVRREEGVVFGPWLLCEAAREGLPFLSVPALLSFDYFY